MGGFQRIKETSYTFIINYKTFDRFTYTLSTFHGIGLNYFPIEVACQGQYRAYFTLKVQYTF